jgi:hypothetical protein
LLVKSEGCAPARVESPHARPIAMGGGLSPPIGSGAPQLERHRNESGLRPFPAAMMHFRPTVRSVQADDVDESATGSVNPFRARAAGAGKGPDLHLTAGSPDPAVERVVEVEHVVALLSLDAAFHCVEDRSRLVNCRPDRGFLGALQGRLDLDCCRALGSGGASSSACPARRAWPSAAAASSSSCHG